jgi:hypothetical protein
MDQKKTWKHVDEIIKILDIGVGYLDFPEDTQTVEDLMNKHNIKKNPKLL